jgi:hypothetical protein
MDDVIKRADAVALIGRCGICGESAVNIVAAINAIPSHAEATEAALAVARDNLAMMIEHYVRLAGCGDCGNWNPEEEPEVIAARNALAKITEV